MSSSTVRRVDRVAAPDGLEEAHEHRPTSIAHAILITRRNRRSGSGLTACTGRGGGYLPPDGDAFTGPASFGFHFNCEDKGGINPPIGQLRIQLSYTDHGTNPLGDSFGIHGIVDKIDRCWNPWSVAVSSPRPNLAHQMS
jgi:hypothetical protein